MKRPALNAKTAIQLLGFGFGVALLVWLIAQVFKEENRAQLQKLAEAPAHQVGFLLALTLTSMVLNGVIFWVVVRPVRRVPMSDVQAVNSIAYLLSSAPLRAGFLLRIFVHSRRNKIPLLIVGGWMGAVAVLILTGMLPMAGASLWRRQLDTLWWLVTIGGVSGSGAAVCLAARFFSSGRGEILIRRVVEGERLGQLHEGVVMLADAGAVALASGLRVIDVMVQALRFTVAAEMVGMELSFDRAVIAATVYFVADSIAPTGSAGVREWVTARAMGSMEQGDFNVLVLTVSASEMIVRFVCAVLGVIWLRPSRLRDTRDDETTPTPDQRSPDP